MDDIPRSVSIAVVLNGDELAWTVEIMTHPSEQARIIGRGATLADASEDAAKQLLALHAA